MVSRVPPRAKAPLTFAFEDLRSDFTIRAARSAAQSETGSSEAASSLQGNSEVEPSDRFRCLELIHLRWQPVPSQSHCECAVLHEIWPAGGLFQTDLPAEAGSDVFLRLPQGEIAGVVRSCTPEETGYILEVAIASSEDWLAGSYRPAELMPISGEGHQSLPIAS